MSIQIHEAHKTLYGKGWKRNFPNWFIVLVQNIQDKERVFKTKREKLYLTCKALPIRLISDFLTEEPIPYRGMPYSVLMQGGGSWSCPNLMCQTLLTPHRSPYLFRGLDCWGGAKGKVRERSRKRDGGETMAGMKLKWINR